MADIGCIVNEEWKPCLEGHYEASTFGRVRRLLNPRSSRPLSPTLKNMGYLYVTAYVHGKAKTIAVHRLVAEAFHGVPRPGQVVNHIDSNMLNNAPENLEWTTQRGNIMHAAALGRLATGAAHGRHTMPERSARGERVNTAILTVEQVIEMRALRATGWSLDRLVDKFGIKKSTICAVCTRQNWKHIP